MSTNKTSHSRMHLWEPQDSFLRSEFNENFIIVDTKLKDLEISSDAKVRSLEESVAVLNTALSQVLSIITGAFMGIGTKNGESQMISLGRKPKVVFIWSIERTLAGQTYTPRHAMLTPGTTLLAGEILDDGFRVDYTADNSGSRYYPALNQSGIYYSYAAFF